MTIADMIGNVDVFSAAVALGIGGGVTIIAVTGLARTPRRKLDMDFRLAEMKQQLDHKEQTQNNEISREKALAEIASRSEVEIRRIDSGMIELKTNNRGSSGEG